MCGEGFIKWDKTHKKNYIKQSGSKLVLIFLMVPPSSHHHHHQCCGEGLPLHEYKPPGPPPLKPLFRLIFFCIFWWLLLLSAFAGGGGIFVLFLCNIIRRPPKPAPLLKNIPLICDPFLPCLFCHPSCYASFPFFLAISFFSQMPQGCICISARCT